ncbi:MAG: hypothetical protein KF774_14645 [Planctomyces sp.]|nr:hypothetical protein [Planctomyces sp.]
MKTLSLTTLLVLLAGANSARADHSYYRRIDRLTADAISDARDLRWTVRDTLSQSRNMRDLLNDADDVLRSLRTVEDLILDEARMSRIHESVDDAIDALRDFDRKLSRSDFATLRPAGFSPRPGGGYAYSPATRHPGYVHVESLRRMAARLETKLDALHDSVEPGYRRPIGRPRGPHLGHAPHPGHVPQNVIQVPVGKGASVVFKLDP